MKSYTDKIFNYIEARSSKPFRTIDNYLLDFEEVTKRVSAIPSIVNLYFTIPGYITEITNSIIKKFNEVPYFNKIITLGNTEENANICAVFTLTGVDVELFDELDSIIEDLKEFFKSIIPFMDTVIIHSTNFVSHITVPSNTPVSWFLEKGVQIESSSFVLTNSSAEDSSIAVDIVSNDNVYLIDRRNLNE